MTNEQIIFSEGQRLMKDGVLKGTGIFIQADVNGQVMEFELPEEIHTFAAWKSKGYKVKKGEKAIARFAIWKYTSREKSEEEKTGNPITDAPDVHMFLKEACFFSVNQVERA